MIKYPNAKKQEVTSNIFTKDIFVGQRFMIDNEPITLIHKVSETIYIFSYDKIYAKLTYDNLEKELESLHKTGHCISYPSPQIPLWLRNKIDFFFIPSEQNITDINRYSQYIIDEYNIFQYYADFNSRSKNWHLSCANYSYWLSDTPEEKPNYACFVTSDGKIAIRHKREFCGMPIFFQITL